MLPPETPTKHYYKPVTNMRQQVKQQRAIQLAGRFRVVQNDTEDEVQWLNCSRNKGDDQ